jgi:exodeoxyribonuclease VII large subunit
MEQLSLHKPSMTLSELNSMIRSVIAGELPDLYWVIAEISELKLNQKGHCYMELVEKEDEKTTAQIKATIWAYEYRTLNRKFESAAKTPLKSGIKVLLLAGVNFHEVYGLSLNIRDVDPAYTVGEMALRRKEIIERLRKEGIIDLNKDLSLPLVPQRIAVVSSPTAAGYGDFTKQLENNPYGYRFYQAIFPALMQGGEAEQSVIAALDGIARKLEHFDAVVIIRGGGSAADLGCFDNYEIAARIARFKLPVITGIGHEKDDTVADIVAHTKMKTPTAVAEFLISGARSFDERIGGIESSLFICAGRLLSQAVNMLGSLSQRFALIVSHVTAGPQGRLGTIEKDLLSRVRQFLQIKGSRLAAAEQAVRHLDPQNVLKRGYSITRLEGTALKDAYLAINGAIIETELYKGIIRSIVAGHGGNDGERKGT